VTSSTATDTRHIREVLPLGLIRDLQAARPALPQPAVTPPSSLKAAIVRWFNEEL
jgi:hypothetical protein